MQRVQYEYQWSVHEGQIECGAEWSAVQSVRAEVKMSGACSPPTHPKTHPKTSPNLLALSLARSVLTSDPSGHAATGCHLSPVIQASGSHRHPLAVPVQACPVHSKQHPEESQTSGHVPLVPPLQALSGASEADSTWFVSIKHRCVLGVHSTTPRNIPTRP